MTTQSLRKKLISQIQSIDDEETLLGISRILEKVNKQVSEPVKLTSKEHEALQVVENEIERGEILSDEEASKEIEKWL